MMQDLRLRKSARKDSERIEKLVYDYYFKLVPVLNGFKNEEELVCKKILDKDSNIIAGCAAYIYQWGCVYVDTLWVDEKYRRQELGSHLLQAVENIAKGKGCHLSYLDTGDFQAKPFYLKHGYTVFATTKDYPKGEHEDYHLFKRFDKVKSTRKCNPTTFEILDGTEEDSEFIDDKLDEYNRSFLTKKHDYIKINRKLVTKDSKVIAAIMAGVGEVDVAYIWKIWVDEEYRHKGLGTLLLEHFEKKAKEKGATKIVAEEIYDWNVNFFLKAGYKVNGILQDLPKGHSYYLIEKEL